MSDIVKTPAGKVEEPASISVISLSQAILAPLDALFKAQVHAARSFLNLLLQIGYPNLELDKDGKPQITSEQTKAMYTQDFFLTDPGGNEMKISIPSLALVPIAPLTIDNASFKLNFKVENQAAHEQMQEASKNVSDAEKAKTDWDEKKRPWYLVKEPVSFKGSVAPSSHDSVSSSQSSSSTINIEINLCRQPLPAGLDKLLTSLQQSTKITHE